MAKRCGLFLEGSVIKAAVPFKDGSPNLELRIFDGDGDIFKVTCWANRDGSPSEVIERVRALKVGDDVRVGVRINVYKGFLQFNAVSVG